MTPHHVKRILTHPQTPGGVVRQREIVASRPTLGRTMVLVAGSLPDVAEETVRVERVGLK